MSRRVQQCVAAGFDDDDVLAMATKKCPLQSLLSDDTESSRDGRAVRALRDWHRRKHERRSTKWEAALIPVHLEKVEAVFSLSKGSRLRR